MMQRIACLICLLCGVVRGQSYVWWEAESASSTNFPPRSSFSPATFADKRSELSGNDWLSVSGKLTGDVPFAKYVIDVPADAEYHFWVRKFWKHGPFRYRFDNAAWTNVGREVALADNVILRTHLNANWVSLGKVSLKKARHSFEFQLLARPNDELVAAFDCFLLTPAPFLPNGKLKPDQKSGKTEAGFFACEPPLDDFRAGALLDLRHLNEKVAGESGPLRRDGDKTTLGSGAPVRFFAVNIGEGNIAQDRSSIDYLARKLAKIGVNMVRIHGTGFALPHNEAQAAKYIDDLHYAVAAFKKEGIYSYLSFYFPLWFTADARSGFAGFENTPTKHPFGLIFFDRKLQEIYRGWLRRILESRNPYTGLAMRQDPAIGIVELINEDSLFFFSFSKRNVPVSYWQEMEQRFGQWLIQRYGSLDKAMAAWNGTRAPGDDPGSSAIGLYEAWGLSGQALCARPGQIKRAGDQTRFLAQVQREFYASTTKYVKEDLRFAGLVVASNWKTADAALLSAIEDHTYTATDIIDRHGYFGGKHEGEGAAYSVRVGHTYEPAAATLQPERVPIQTHQVAGFPQIISELGWTNPNPYRADAVFISSAYGALQGIDGLFFFAVGSNYLRDGTMNKFAASSPLIAGAFPAAALAYRRGDLAEAQTAVHQVLDLDELFAMKGSGTTATDALDEIRKRDLPPDGLAGGPVRTFDPLSFYVGRVTREFGKDTTKSFQRNLLPYIDRSGKTVRSMTGELTWDYGNGLIRVTAPRLQAAAGFLGKAKTIDLPFARIECGNEYASILIISLDDQPLATSARILIQAATTEKLFGFASPGGKITDVGGPPMLVEKIKAKVTLRTRGTPKVIALDENGYAALTAVSATASDGAAEIILAPDALYHIVQP